MTTYKALLYSVYTYHYIPICGVYVPLRMPHVKLIFSMRWTRKVEVAGRTLEAGGSLRFEARGSRLEAEQKVQVEGRLLEV
jgi:hypothetical protein